MIIHLLKLLLWGIKQLLPLTYRSIYSTEGRIVYHTWKMWFGRCYSQEWVTATLPVSPSLDGAVSWLIGINPEKDGPFVPDDKPRPPELS